MADINRNWTLLTHRGACLLLLASRGSATVREIATSMQVTERSAARMVADLRADGYIAVKRVGRRNQYAVNLDAPLRHPIGEGRQVGHLFAGVLELASSPAAG